MKKNVKKLILSLIAAFLALASAVLFFCDFSSQPAMAAGTPVTDNSFSVPYETLTLGPNGALVPTQTAYVPSGRISLSSSTYGALSSPEDMIIDKQSNRIYIADTGKGRVIATDMQGEVTAVIGDGVLKQPTGLAVGGGNLFVCDKENKLVYIYDCETFELVNTIDRPDNPLVGANTPYVPVKITVDSRGNMYIVSEGCVSGLMQINAEGEFVGYVGANETPASFLSVLQKIFFSEEQQNAFLQTPKSPTNVAIDDRGLVYTITNNASSGSVKKLNTMGNGIMSPSMNFSDTTAASVDSSENIFTVQSNIRDGSYVTVFDSEGNLLFRFGGADGYERFGSLANPVAVGTPDDGRVMVLDKNYSMVIIYERTDFANLVFGAVDYYKDGLYLEGEGMWNEVLRYNSNFILAYKALARANMKRSDYGTALSQFKYAEDRTGYSEAFWQIRNEWLENNLLWVIIVALVIVAAVIVIKILNKRKPKLFVPIKKGIAKVEDAHVKNVYFFKEFKHAKRFMRSTQDAVYEVKYHGKASVWTASILFVWFVVLQILGVVTKGYLFNSATVYNTNGWNMVLVTIGVFIALVLCNYFVSTVTDGDGKLLHCFICFMYALSPYLVMALPVYLLSNVLTFNESVIYTFCEIVMYGWSGICLFRAIMELHDYSFGKTVKNILLTVFAFAMALLFIIVLRMLFAQLFGYTGSILGEVFGR